MRKRPSTAFYLSIAFLALFLLVMVFGSWLKPHGISPEDKINMIQYQADGKTRYSIPPYAPNGTFLLGTDHRGYDMLSLLLNGLKYTLGTALGLTLLRFAFALPWGLWSGMTGRTRGLLRSLQWAIAAVPAFIFLYPPLAGMYYGLRLDLGAKADPHNQLIFSLTFIILVTLIGLFPLAHQIADRTRYYRCKMFIEASRLMGGSFWHRTLRHIVPSMRNEMMFIFLSEFMQVLFLLGQLAVFHIVLGGTETIGDEEAGFQITISTSGEWLSLIAYGSRYIRLHPWIILSSGTCFALLFLSLQFFLSQLKRRYGEERQLM
ncbi:ABC transporter permease subunit [Paenibacillus roseipurpureus]|uniref:ABC transporter permease subunit n=1 Tax=Paenibacillus roseopurpureus TaxID=2918901 RepID=A0AA96RII4_9BACL|nr:ABC transporter permease subunit [Paenibacillus sp. MBLB1832]WNR44343.1 ABC transporter permease subunit [Paenibacillus sp. MBLB1832]